MRRITSLMSAAVVTVLGVTAPVAMAQQHPGFRIAIAQPAFGFPTPQPPAIVTRSTFVAVSTVAAPAQPVLPAFSVQQSMVPVFVPQQTVIIPNQVLVPGQTFVPAPFVGATPWSGTSRNDVLRQFGQPSVTIITSTGETLCFTGGVTVIIQNGQVAGPR